MSSVERLMFITVTMYLFIFFFLRCTLAEIESVNLSKESIKKRRKGQSFLEWITARRFRDVIPWFVVPVYYIILLVNTIGLLSVVFLFIFQDIYEDKWNVFRLVSIFNMFWFIVLLIASADPKCPRSRVELWVPDIKTGKTAKRYKSRAEYEASMISAEAREGYENWTKNLELISAGGTIENTEGGLIGEEQVKYMIKVSKGTYISTDEPDEEHEYRHIHFETQDGKDGVIKIAEKSGPRKAIYNTEVH